MKWVLRVSPGGERNLLLIILSLSEKNDKRRSVQETFFSGYSADLLGFSDLAASLMLLE